MKIFVPVFLLLGAAVASAQIVTTSKAPVHPADEARAKADRGDFNGAIQGYGRCIQNEPKSFGCYGERGRVYAQMSKYESAIRDYTEAIAFAPDVKAERLRPYAPKPKFLVLRGEAYAAQKKNDLAKADFDAALAIDADFYEALIAKGRLLKWTGDRAGAISHFELARSKAPHRDEAGRELGDIAASEAAAVAATPPADPGAWIKLLTSGTDKLKAKDHNGAIEAFTACLKLTKAVRCYHSRALAYSFLKKYETALADADAAIKISPESADTYNLRATIHTSMGELLLALNDHTQAIKHEPDNPDWYRARAELQCSIGRKVLAKADEVKAKQLGGKITNPCK